LSTGEGYGPKNNVLQLLARAMNVVHAKQQQKEEKNSIKMGKLTSGTGPEPDLRSDTQQREAHKVPPKIC
jgi:hypothetical protein